MQADPQLGFWDTISVIVGIVVGTAIFVSPPLVFQNTGSTGQALALWGIGGVLSLCGAFCYAELATTYPENGGDYQYLTRAFGRWMGFFFAWAQLTAVLSGSVAALSYAFGDHAVRLLGWQEGASVGLAALAVVLVCGINLLGVVVGKATQNLLTATKVLGLLSVAIAGLVLSGDAEAALDRPAQTDASPQIGLALVFVLYAFGGWNDAAFVAAEVRDPSRNIPRALIGGIGGVTLIYLVVNVAYAAALGPENASSTHAPAVDLMQRVAGPWGARIVSVLVMISALGAINGMTLTGSRIFASFGRDHPVFAWLGRWSQQVVAPINALLTQSAIALLMILAVGTELGQQGFDKALTTLGMAPIPWADYFGGFEILLASTAPVFWGFFLLTGLAIPVLRHREPQRQRPFRVPLYPLPLVVFLLTCGYMLWSSLQYAGWLALLGAVPLAIAVPLYFLPKQASGPAAPRRR